MSRSFPTLLCLAGLALIWGLACAGRPEVVSDPDTDFSRFETWSWLPGKSVVVHSGPVPEAEVERELRALIQAELAPRGLRQVDTGGDLHIGALYAGAQSFRLYEQVGAVETLSSLHETPSFEAQAPSMEVQMVERCRMGLFVSEARTRQLLWRSLVEEERVGGCQPHLADSMGSLLGDFPLQP